MCFRYRSRGSPAACTEEYRWACCPSPAPGGPCQSRYSQCSPWRMPQWRRRPGRNCSPRGTHAGIVSSWRTLPNGEEPWCNSSWRTTAYGKNPHWSSSRLYPWFCLLVTVISEWQSCPSSLFLPLLCWGRCAKEQLLQKRTKQFFNLPH